MTPAGIEPATFRFVAEHLNRCATAVPNNSNNNYYYYLCVFAGFFHGVIKIFALLEFYAALVTNYQSTLRKSPKSKDLMKYLFTTQKMKTLSRSTERGTEPIASYTIPPRVSVTVEGRFWI